MMRRAVCLLCLALVATVAAVDDGHALRLAARSGDLAEVKRLVEAGADVDAADEWGTTPLLLAAGQSRLDVMSYLLSKGADPGTREGFFGSSVLDRALRGGEPDYEVARMLLAAGAPDRARALEHAFRTGNHELARAAAEAGPVRESEAADLRARFNGLDDTLAALLAGLKTEPDPPPPVYSEKDLAKFAGVFEAENESAEVFLREGKLVLRAAGEERTLAPLRERTFRGGDPAWTIAYFGRAGSVESVSLERGGAPLRMRPAESPVVGAADLPEFVENPARKPVVDWPGFRGENRDGIGDGIDTPVDFDLESGRGVAWIAPLPGLGNSSPVVWGDRVYVTTAVADEQVPLRVGLTGAGDEIEESVEHRWLLLAFDKNDGTLLWQTEVGRGVPLTKRHFKATQANSTPVTDGEHVVVVFPTAGLACVGRDGKLHWKRELGGLNAGGFNDPGMQWGFAASPILHDGKVVLQVDIHDGPYLATWSLADGKPLWKTERPDVAPSWATPAIWRTPEGDELVVNASIIRGYDPDDGKELWSLGPTSIQVVASPVLGGNTLYVSSGYPPARPIYAVRPGIRGKHTIESDADAGPLVWYTERGGAYMPTPLLYRGLLYIVHHNGRIVGHDARNGDRVYQGRLSAGGTCTSSPVAANGKIYQGTEEGTLYVLAAGPEHRELAVHDFGEPLMATPAISAGTLLVRTPSRLIALREPTSEER